MQSSVMSISPCPATLFPHVSRNTPPHYRQVLLLIITSVILARINEPEHECNKAPKWVQNVVMRVLFFMTTIGNAIDAALV